MKFIIRFFILCSLGISLNSLAMGYSKDYETCMKSVQNQMVTISTCQEKEYKVQNKRMKKNYKEKLSILSNSEKSMFKQVHNNWLKQRDQVCGLEKNKSQLLNANFKECYLQVTMSRADMLEYGLK